MLTPTGFPSWSNYFHFCVAREFVDAETGNVHVIEKSALARIGKAFSSVILYPLNFFVREIKNPLVILSLTISLIALTTLIFYPTVFMSTATTLFPFLVKIRPWMVKGAVFVVAEMTILGIGLRALSRVTNKALLHMWHAHEIIPLHIGAKRYR